MLSATHHLTFEHFANIELNSIIGTIVVWVVETWISAYAAPSNVIDPAVLT